MHALSALLEADSAELFDSSAESSSDLMRSCEEHGPYRAIWMQALKKHAPCPVCTRRAGNQYVQEEIRRHKLAASDRVMADMSSLRAASGLVGWLGQCRLSPPPDDISDRSKVLLRLIRYIENAPRIQEKGTWGLLAGGFGTGKTFALAAVANELMAKGRSCLFVRASDVIERVMQNRGGASQNKNWIAEADFLFIDECTPPACEHPAFFDALDQRYLISRPTLFSGNAAVMRSPDPVIARETLGDRIGDRLFDRGGQVLRFSWPSLRQSKNTEPLF